MVLVASGRGGPLLPLSECMKAFSMALRLRKYRGSTDDEKIKTRFCEAKIKKKIKFSLLLSVLR